MLVTYPKIFSTKLFSLMLIVVMVLCSVTLLLPTTHVKAVGTYDNASIADKALGYVGRSGTAACSDAGKTGGDQCKQFVNCIVYMASNHTQWPVDPNGNYQNSYSDVGGVEITDLSKVQKGDIVQAGNSDYSHPLHTAIVVVNKGQANSKWTFNVVDANWGYWNATSNAWVLDGMVRQHDYSPPSDARYWRMGTPASSSTTNPPPSGQGSGVGTTGTYKGTDHLVVNQPLYQNQYLTTPDGEFVLMMQADGNLVEYGPGYHPKWGSGTGGTGAGYVVLQPDGNLVIYMPDGQHAVWGNGRPNSGNNNALWLQPDGNLVEYTSGGSAVWSTGTNVPNYTPPAYKGSDNIATNVGLYQNQYLRSQGGTYFLLFQPDGSAVIYSPGYHVIGGFGKGGSNAGYIVVQPDGNLVEYMPDGVNAVWGSNTPGSGATYLVVQNDGNVVLYTANNNPVWGSGTAGLI